MPEFTYEGMDSKGKEVTGSVTADSKVNAINEVRKLGYFPTSMKEKKSGAPAKKGSGAAPAVQSGGKKSIMDMFSGVGERDMVTFMRQFATLVDAGLPILRCLRVLEKQFASVPAFQKIIRGLGDSVESGNTLSSSLTSYHAIFSSLFINMIRAGEAGGVLDRVLLQLADYYESSLRLKKKIKAAMIYPSLVLMVSGAVVTFLMKVIIPKFSKMFIEMGMELPGVTQFLINISNFFQDYWWTPPLGILGFFIVYKIISGNSKGRYMIHATIYNSPLVGILVMNIAVARFSRTLGTLIESGVPILEAIMITRSTVGNAVVEKALTLVHDNVREGQSIAQPLEQAGIFPPMVISMVAIGEETGRISDMLTKIADNNDENVDMTVTTLTSLIEPAMIVGLAGIVAFIVIAMFLPMVKMIEGMANA